MALFTDSEVITIDDLLHYENSLVTVSSSHAIDIKTKINLAIAEIGDRVMLWLLKVRASDPQWLQRRSLGLSTVVLTPTLQRWICFESLSRFFEEAYNVQLNTRFEGKWTEYQQLSKAAADMAFISGLGIVAKALPKPILPLVTIGSGNSLPSAMFLQTAWVDADGNEGALSPINGQVLSAGMGVTVAISSSSQIPPAAAGWNLYASATENDLTRQNNAPLANGTTWTLPPSGLVEGPEPVDGQAPTFYIDLSRQMQRG
jgi:hypothetical protein